MAASEAVERESLEDALRNTVEEARMVIPGVQALFGFQTMAVFNQRFEDLPEGARTAYLVGLGCLVLAIALLMAPAAYHRIAERGIVSSHMVEIASRLIAWGMVPLMFGLALDVHVVCVAALDDARVGMAAGGVSLVGMAALWFAWPWWRSRHRPAAAG